MSTVWTPRSQDDFYRSFDKVSNQRGPLLRFFKSGSIRHSWGAGPVRPGHPTPATGPAKSGGPRRSHCTIARELLTRYTVHLSARGVDNDAHREILDSEQMMRNKQRRTQKEL